MKKQKICIIIPLYYGEKYIEPLIRRVEDMCDKVCERVIVELVFVNDSPEKKIQGEYNSDKLEIKIISPKTNSGIHGARVYGLMHSQSDFVYFLDQDDIPETDFLVKQLDYIQEYDAVVCNALHGERASFNIDRPTDTLIDIEHMIGRGNMIISPGQVLLRREAVPNLWTQRVMQYGGADDWLLWIEMLLAGKKFCVNPEILFTHRIGYQNMSFNEGKMKRSEREVYEILQKEEMLSGQELKKLETTIERISENRIQDAVKCKSLFFVLDRWMQNREAGRYIDDFLRKMEIRSIDIYGYGRLGKHLYWELVDRGFSVGQIFDRNAECIMDTAVRVVTPDHMEESAGYIIVTTLYNREIENRLRPLYGKKIIWIEEIVDGLCREG